MDKQRNGSYPLRIAEDLRTRVQEQAGRNRRSLNAELGLLIEEGLKWREMRNKQAVA